MAQCTVAAAAHRRVCCAWFRSANRCDVMTCGSVCVCVRLCARLCPRASHACVSMHILLDHQHVAAMRPAADRNVAAQFSAAQTTRAQPIPSMRACVRLHTCVGGRVHLQIRSGAFAARAAGTGTMDRCCRAALRAVRRARCPPGSRCRPGGNNNALVFLILSSSNQGVAPVNGGFFVSTCPSTHTCMPCACSLTHAHRCKLPIRTSERSEPQRSHVPLPVGRLKSGRLRAVQCLPGARVKQRLHALPAAPPPNRQSTEQAHSAQPQ